MVDAGSLPLNVGYTLLKTIADADASTNAVRFSPDGRRMATGASDGCVRVYSTADWSLLATLRGHRKGVSAVEFSPTAANVLASCSDDLSIRIWQVDAGRCVRVLHRHTYHITAIRFDSTGNVLVSGSADENITVWDVSHARPLKTLAAHSDPISSVALTPDNTIIVSASFDGLMRLFDAESGQCLKTLTYNSSSHGTATASTTDVVNFPISHVECSPNGRYILSSSLDGVIRLWNYMENKVVKTYKFPGEPICNQYCCGAKFVVGGGSQLVVSGSDARGLLLWDVQSKRLVSVLPVAGAVLDVDDLDGGRLLACCSTEGRVYIYERNQ
ncbi:Uncharacterized protein ABC855_g4715 [[Candida] zeylanoides]